MAQCLHCLEPTLLKHQAYSEKPEQPTIEFLSSALKPWL